MKMDQRTQTSENTERAFQETPRHKFLLLIIVRILIKVLQ